MPPKKKIKEEPKTDVINFYELKEVQTFSPVYNNPTYDRITQPLKHPLYLLICGTTGSGKTNVLMNIICKMDSTFNRIKIFTQNKNEPLYEWLESKIEKPYLEIYEGLSELNKMDLDKMEKNQYLFIYDDMCLEKDQSKIEQMFIRGRKLSISNIYLSQSYFTTPKIIRKQINYLILKKINGSRDINSILKECSMQVDKKQLQRMFNFCVQSREDISNFFLIDLGASDELRFRKNFSMVLNPENF